jgi:hypothetical protein
MAPAGSGTHFHPEGVPNHQGAEHVLTRVPVIPGPDKLFAVGARTFVGYRRTEVDEFRAQIEGHLSDEPRRVDEFSNVVLQPLSRVAFSAFEGGVYQEGEYLDQLRLMRGLAKPYFDRPLDPIIPEPCQHFHVAWYGGTIFKNYGHFLLESLARLLDPRVIHSTEPIIFFNPSPVVMMPPWMSAMLSHVGIQAERIVLCNHPIAVEKLLCLEPAVVARNRINVSCAPALRKVHAERTIPLIYLSRGRITRSQRSVAQECLLEELIRAYGGEIIYPEMLPFAEQVDVMSRARTVVSIEGSALHTLIFTSGCLNTVAIAPAKPSSAFFHLDELIEGDSFYIKGISDADELSMNRKSWTVTPSTVSLVSEVLSRLSTSDTREIGTVPAGRRHRHVSGSPR